jgi:RNA polymerase sigma-70 factor (ECF subfamily)
MRPRNTGLIVREAEVPETPAAKVSETPALEVPLEVGALYRAHAGRVAHWASRLGGPAIDLEDVVQEVFLTVHRLLPGFRGDAKVSTWLFRITENVVRHRRRKERWRRWLGGAAEAERVASARPTPVEELERRQTAERVYRVLDRLPEKYRAVLILFEIDGASGEEIAQLTGTRLETVWVQLHRARKLFLADIEGQP